MKTIKAKSLILMIVFIVSVIQSFGITSMAASNPTVYSPAVEATAGEELRVPVYIKDNTGIMAWELFFEYDDSVLTPTGIESGEAMDSSVSGFLMDSIGSSEVSGSFNVIWCGSEDEVYNGIMFCVVFEVSAQATRTTDIEISFEQSNTFNEDFDDVYLNCETVTVNIANNLLTDYVKFYARTSVESVMAGEGFSVFIGVDEINGLTSAELAAEYDTVYEYDTLNFDIDSVNALSGATVSFSDENGRLNLSLGNLGADLVGKDIIEIKLTSKPKSAAGKHVFSFASENPAVFGCDCSVNIKATATSETALVYGTEKTAIYNETVKIPVYIRYNKGISGYRLKFRYDTSALQAVSANVSTLFSKQPDEIKEAVFFDYSVDEENGLIDVIWLKTKQVKDNGEMLTLSFKVLTENTCTSTVAISYVQADTYNDKNENVVLDCQNIELSLNPGCEHNYSCATTEATCTADGVRTYTCSKCNESYTEVIPKLGHDYKSVVTAPTCEAGGYTTHTCSRCNDTYKDSETPKLGHNYTSKVTKAATCTADGVRTYTCSNCNDSYTETIAKLGHDYKSVVTAPTCESGGYTTHTCSRCSDTYIDSETPELGHSYTSKVTKAATCTADGEKTYTCSNCNDCYTEVITKLGHDYKSVVTAPTCESGGYTTHTCSNCGDAYTDNEVAALGHSYDETVVFATCTEMGYTVHVCSNCNNSYKDKYVSPLGHDYEVVVMSATCLTGGYTEHTCQRCEDCYADCHTDALSHDFGEWSTVIQPQADKRGLAERGCSRCEETEQKVLYFATPEISFDAAEKTIRYGETLVLTPVIANIPEGVTVEWEIDGNGVYSEYNEEENAWYITAIDSGIVEVCARLVDENGEPVLDENGEEITAEMKVTVKSNFFLKIISFFKNLFRMNRFVY